MKHLWLIRHAKTVWADVGQRDFDRTLAPRGIADAELMVGWLRSQPEQASWIVSSTAARAAATADYVQEAFDLPAVQRIDTADLYLATPETLVDCIRELPKECECAAVVAHNPGISQTVSLLTGQASGTEMPTFGCALLGYSGTDWSALAQGCCELLRLQRPKALRN